MDIYIQLAVLSVAVAGSAFLGHAIGYRKAEKVVSKKLAKIYLNATYGRFPETTKRLREAIDKHNAEIGL